MLGCCSRRWCTGNEPSTSRAFLHIHVLSLVSVISQHPLTPHYHILKEGRELRKSLDDYRGIVNDAALFDVHRTMRSLYGSHVVHINSTAQGGGVAEMLSSLVPLMNDVGLNTGWRILHGTPDFFSITKKFHNALQGEEINLTDIKKEVYTSTNESFAQYTHIKHDCIVVHDPQPLPLIRYYRKVQPWIWRCHVDLSNPNEEVWDYLKQFVLRYDYVIVSNEAYKRDDLPVEQRVIPPAIDPLSPKNMELPPETITKYVEKFCSVSEEFCVLNNKPLLVQISRFDKWKDPLGVIEVFRRVKEEEDCRLVLCGSTATDDPEGTLVYDMVRKEANDLIKSGDVILLTVENNIVVNALQRAAAVVIQKSLREGFGLTVTEAMWKAKPVVASNVGGIPLQIRDGRNGFLVEPDDIDGFVDRILEVLRSPNLAQKLGERARETVRDHFLITKHLHDCLELLVDVMSNR